MIFMLNTMKILIQKILKKIKVGDHVRISKHKTIFAKGHTLNWLKEVFVVSKIKNTVPWAYVINDLKEITRFFMKKNCKKFRIEKRI